MDFLYFMNRGSVVQRDKWSRTLWDASPLLDFNHSPETISLALLSNCFSLGCSSRVNVQADLAGTPGRPGVQDST